MCPKPMVLPAVNPVSLKAVTWKVFVDNGVSYFALDAKGYEDLATNNAELLRWVKEASFQMKAYREDRAGETEK